MVILFDLDFTLIDSRSIVQLRQTRQQHAAYAMIPQLVAYPGISELLRELNQRQIPIAIVTSSRKPFCDRIIAQQQWSIDIVVSRQDVRSPKPHPAGISIALERLGVKAGDAVMVGDSADDIAAARSVGVYSIGALWGCQTPELLIATNPDKLCMTVRNLHDFLISVAVV
jgi:HAD superfamily hydrolase (TIGR01509 family)